MLKYIHPCPVLGYLYDDSAQDSFASLHRNVSEEEDCKWPSGRFAWNRQCPYFGRWFGCNDNPPRLNLGTRVRSAPQIDIDTSDKFSVDWRLYADKVTVPLVHLYPLVFTYILHETRQTWVTWRQVMESTHSPCLPLRSSHEVLQNPSFLLW